MHLYRVFLKNLPLQKFNFLKNTTDAHLEPRQTFSQKSYIVEVRMDSKNTSALID